MWKNFSVAITTLKTDVGDMTRQHEGASADRTGLSVRGTAVGGARLRTTIMAVAGKPVAWLTTPVSFRTRFHQHLL